MDQAISRYGSMLTGQEAVERQLGWKPKFVEVNKQRFLVELWPVWTDALSALIAARRDPYARHEEGVDEAGLYLREEDYELKGCLNVFYVSEGFELEVLVRIEPDQLKERFPAEILLPGLKGDLKPCTQVQARVVWSNGDKQSAACSVRHTSNDDFDLIQSVRRERRVRGIEGEENTCVLEGKAEPYVIVVNGKTRRFEIAPRVCNVWHRAFATYAYNDDDLEFYEQQKEYTEFVFVGQKRTLMVTATFAPVPGAVLKAITLPKMEAGEAILGRMTFEGGLESIFVVRGWWRATTAEDLLEIERVRRNRKRVGGDGAGQLVYPRVGVRAMGEASAGDAGDQAPSERHEGKMPTAATGPSSGVPIIPDLNAIVSASVKEQLELQAGPKKARRKNNTYMAKHKREIYDEWQNYRHKGGTRLSAFFSEYKELCQRNNCKDVKTLTLIIDSERKARKGCGI